MYSKLFIRMRFLLPSVLVLSMLSEEKQLSAEKDGSRTETGLGCL